MVFDPGTAMLIASAVSAAAGAGGQALSGAAAKRAEKRRAKETKRETHAGLFNDALDRAAELEAHGLSSRQKLGKAKTNASQNTADLVRGALRL